MVCKEMFVYFNILVRVEEQKYLSEECLFLVTLFYVFVFTSGYFLHERKCPLYMKADYSANELMSGFVYI